ncbi:MAG: hypothetical protein GF353_21670, partial [Candidatus Lokiarchaeota archaeon]|nr:hypothetical protein [Candidatus Lokiarchaeota archaeon]
MVIIIINQNERDYDQEFCPECGGNIIINSFERTCSECGLVISECLVDTSYLLYDCNNKTNLNKQYVALGGRHNFIGGLGTFIDYEKSKYLKDKSGKLLPPDEQKLFRRLKKNYSQFVRIKNHETEFRIFNILNKIAAYLSLNDNICKTAAYFYRKILKKENKVINNISLIAFCIFYAARNESHNAPITINEIAQAFQSFGHRVKPRLILRDGIKYKKHLASDLIPHKSEDYLIRLIDNVIKHKDLKKRLKKKEVYWKINLFQMKLMNECHRILKNLGMKERGGRNPFILAGAVIYLADKLLAKKYNQKSILTQKIIAEATKIAEYSIRD